MNDVFYLKASFCMFLVASAALVLFLLFFCLILKGEGSLPSGKKNQPTTVCNHVHKEAKLSCLCNICSDFYQSEVHRFLKSK